MAIVLPLLKIRQVTHTLFAGFEHVCAVGYALNEFEVKVGHYVLFLGSVGLLIFMVAVLFDHLMKHWGWFNDKIMSMRSRQYVARMI